MRTRHGERVRARHGRRPTAPQWVRYAFGARLPRELAPWVLHDITARGWVWRHLERALTQLLPLVVLCLTIVPTTLGYRLSMAAGGVLLGLTFSLAYCTETAENRARKAGYPPGTAASLRAERVERERLERRSPYRRDGAGSFD